jgi:hypothetical protein
MIKRTQKQQIETLLAALGHEREQIESMRRNLLGEFEFIERCARATAERYRAMAAEHEGCEKSQADARAYEAAQDAWQAAAASVRRVFDIPATEKADEVAA